jgi:hypothetical protein
MDDAQRKQVKENGFLIIKDALTPATVALLNDIFVRPRPSLAGPFIARIIPSRQYTSTYPKS